MTWLDKIADSGDKVFEPFDKAVDKIVDTLTSSAHSNADDAFADATRKANDPAKVHDGSVEVNGVIVPQMVADQLAKLGVPLSRYSSTELEAAIRACSFDNNLIDDDDGQGFYDKLELTDGERSRKNTQAPQIDDDDDDDLAQLKALTQNRAASKGNSYGARIKQEREQKRIAALSGEECIPSAT